MVLNIYFPLHFITGHKEYKNDSFQDTCPSLTFLQSHKSSFPSIEKNFVMDISDLKVMNCFSKKSHFTGKGLCNLQTYLKLVTLITGVDKDGVFTNKHVGDGDLKGDRDLRKQVNMPKDLCVALTQESDGSVFNTLKVNKHSEILCLF